MQLTLRFKIVNLCSKCAPHTRTQALRRWRHWLIAASTIDWSRDARLHTSDTVAAEFARSEPGRLQHLECSAGKSLPLQNCWRQWTQNTSDRWVGAVWPVDRWRRFQPVASPSKRLCPCMRGTLRAQIL